MDEVKKPAIESKLTLRKESIRQLRVQTGVLTGAKRGPVPTDGGGLCSVAGGCGPGPVFKQ
jgi:hypothetical protein